jgi:hypothetical protein
LSKKIVQNPRKKQGEGELMFEVRYAEADCHTGYEKEAIENLCGAIKEAKAEFPQLPGDTSNREDVQEWFKKWFGGAKVEG